jgi:hypothetical protein
MRLTSARILLAREKTTTIFYPILLANNQCALLSYLFEFVKLL